MNFLFGRNFFLSSNTPVDTKNYRIAYEFFLLDSEKIERINRLKNNLPVPLDSGYGFVDKYPNGGIIFYSTDRLVDREFKTFQ